GSRRRPFASRQPGRGGTDGKTARRRRTLRSTIWTQRSGTRTARPAWRGPDQQADRGQDVPRGEDHQELRVAVVGQAGHGAAHPGGGVHLETGSIRPPPRGLSGHDGRATITGMRAVSATAVLTEPSSIPAKPPRP